MTIEAQDEVNYAGTQVAAGTAVPPEASTPKGTPGGPEVLGLFGRSSSRSGITDSRRACR